MEDSVSLTKPWYSYTQWEINYHMAEHSTAGKKFGFCGYDLEFSYLLGHKVHDFQTICRNRIIKTLQGEGIPVESELGVPTQIRDKLFDQVKVSGYDIAYQAQNLVYMYSLGLVDTLDTHLIGDIRDTTVRNGYRKHQPVLDGILPIFAEAIGMKDEISLDDVHDARDYYLSKRPIAQTILEVSREFKIRFKDVTLSRIGELQGIEV